ncbi:ribonuclease H-like YkuK family protein [Candidatus Woesearchaeota archaeon]|nr:ribonuclease H-like YkuK family protein [Candidatus Woesearchaeota archaeon]
MKWRTLNGKHIEDIKQELFELVETHQQYDLEFACGTDSQFHKRKKRKGFYITYITALTVRFLTPGQIWTTDKQRRDRVGHGGRVFYFKETESVTHHFPLEVRLTTEVGKAIDVAQFIDKTIEPLGYKIYDIHLDLNPDKVHLSNKVLGGCSGWVKGMGYCPVIKPDSYVASKIADKKTR